MNQKARAEPLPYMWNLFPLILFLEELHHILDSLPLIPVQGTEVLNKALF